MTHYVVDNLAGIVPNEKTVLKVFEERISRALEHNQKISFYVAVGFFFFEGFQKLHKLFREVYEKGLLKEFKIVMGPETRRTTKEVLEALKNDAAVLDYETFDFIKKLYDEKKFDFRIFLERSFHIKLYLFDIDNELEVWAGSANLTEAGLEENIELIVPAATFTFEEKDLYRKFFEEIWKRSTDKVENLRVIDVIREASKSDIIYLHPRDFIINLVKILGKEYLIKNVSVDLSYLAEFQNMSYYLCINKLNRYGGCILANSFGLGKTDVGCVVARYYRELGKKVLIIYPPILKEHWKRTMTKVGVRIDDVEWLSRGQLQKSDFNYEQYQDIDLIIVDEAHHFRISKPKSNRRENLENIIKVNPKCHVLLITATPINTSLSDFIELLKLFVKGKYKERLEAEGIILKMRELEHELRKDVHARNATALIRRLNELIRVFTVRIEWPDLPLYFKEDLKKIANVDSIESPDVIPVRYRYDEEIVKKIFDQVVPFLSDLNFEYTKLWEKEYKEDKNLIWWYKWRLYKRLESSIAAFRVSLKNLLDKNKFLHDFLTKVNANPKFWRNTDLFTRERLETIKDTFLTIKPVKRSQVLSRIKSDILLIEGMLRDIERIKNLEERDEKIRRLIEILKVEKKPTLVFSESKDTVLYIGEQLRKHGGFRFEMAYGGEEPVDEETGERIKPAIRKENIEKKFNEGVFDILVSTDIMGEGVNLPRADIVINFDLHYNPVRLIQRDGRAIRINNPKKIWIYNFRPDERIDKELELCDRLAERVENIVATIGMDFLIWSMEEKKVKAFSEENRKRIIKLIGEYKNLLASKTPEELKKGVPPTLSKEDKALREFIKFWGISEETIEARAKKYRKPIFTSLKRSGSSKYFVAFDYRGGIFTLGELSFSNSPAELNLNKDDLSKIDSMISEKCLELDREFLRTSSRKDKTTFRIEKIIEKNEALKEAFRNVDISLLPKKFKTRILKNLENIEKSPPWRREEQIQRLKSMLEEKMKIRSYQRSIRPPRLLAVIKYD